MTLIHRDDPDTPWYSDLRPFFAALGDAAEQYSWFVTDLECTPPLKGQHRGSLWMSASDIRSEITDADRQFIWAVLSAIPIQHVDEARNIEEQPYADGNSDLWSPSAAPQHPHAAFEVVCWDSSATLLIAKKEASHAVEAFRQAYPASAAA